MHIFEKINFIKRLLKKDLDYYTKKTLCVTISHWIVSIVFIILLSLSRSSYPNWYIYFCYAQIIYTIIFSTILIAKTISIKKVLQKISNNKIESEENLIKYFKKNFLLSHYKTIIESLEEKEFK